LELDTSSVVVAKPPSFFSEGELQDFISMVRAGGEVGGKSLEDNVRGAERLVSVRRGECLVGVAALKRPRDDYRQDTQTKSGVDLAKTSFPFEFGYLFVLPSARRMGYAKKLSAAALAETEDIGVFATVRTSNKEMLAFIPTLGFAKRGKPYASRRGRYQLQVFVKEPTVWPGTALQQSIE